MVIIIISIILLICLLPSILIAWKFGFKELIPFWSGYLNDENLK